jgi:hypothetical protein
MAPESTGGDYSPAGDVFSWGVSICIVACMALPEPPVAMGATRDAITQLGLRLIRAELPAVADLVEQCMHLKQAKRPCSTEVRDKLLQIVGLWPHLGKEVHS